MLPSVLNISLPSLPPFDLILVEGGEFLMGGSRKVNVNPCYLGKHQVPQALWEGVTGENPARFKGKNRPVESVSWDDVQGFIKKLNKETGRTFRLPSEAEWEYAARGGIYSQGYDYCGSDKLKQVGWYDENSNAETHDAGLLLANELGIYDMSGNVWEWCEDWFDEKFYEKCKKQGLVENPVNTARGGRRVFRGGSFFFTPSVCRPSYRFSDPPGLRSYYLGFRLSLPFQSVG
jgi:formylglycine-generating enzyme required for sulfatase activity